MSDDNFEFESNSTDTEYMTAQDLLHTEISELDNLFMKASTPKLSEFDGSATCLWLAGPMSNFLPESIKAIRPIIAGNPMFPWKGMEFEQSFGGDDVTGVNLMLGGLKAFNFKAETGSSRFDEEECVVFDYNVDGNIPPFRALRDEVRKLNDRLYLGRGNFIAGEKCVFIAYFTVELG